MAIERTFTLPQIAALAGAEYRTLHTWLQRGLLVPSRQEALGAGTANLFSSDDALEACIFADLRRAGFGMGALEGLARGLRDLPQRLQGNEFLFINGSVRVLAHAHAIPGAVRTGTPALVYDVSQARAAVDSAAGQ